MPTRKRQIRLNRESAIRQGGRSDGDLSSLRRDFRRHKEDEARWQTSVMEKLDAIMNIKVNGFEPLPGEKYPFQTTIRGLYEGQKDKIVNRQFHKSLAAWWNQKWISGAFRSKLVRGILYFLVWVLINSLMKKIGASLSLQGFNELLHIAQ